MMRNHFFFCFSVITWLGIILLRNLEDDLSITKVSQDWKSVNTFPIV